jgi:hypothetical protein
MLENSSINFSKELVDAICCPFTSKPFVDAQMVNCESQHSFSLEAVIQLFGKMMDTQCEKIDFCPICRSRVKVTAYQKNPALQNIVNAFLGQSNSSHHMDNMFSIIQGLKLEFESGIRYPLGKAKFNARIPTYKSDSFNFIFENVLASGTPQNEIFKLWFTLDDNILSVHIMPREIETSLSLLDFFEKNKIDSFNIYPQCTQLQADTEDVSHFLSILALITLHNDFSGMAKLEIVRLQKFCKKLLNV